MLRLYALSCGSLEFDRSLFFPADAQGTKITTPVSSWLVVHPKGTLVFDTGISCEALPDPAGRLGKRIAALFAIRSRAGEDVVSQLATLGLKPDDIRYVVNSHFHFDHCGCNESFPRAQFLVQRAELALARAERNRYNAKDWDHPLEYVEIDGELPTPGHTAGHQSLWIREGGRQLVLTGDACYTREHLEKTILPSNTFDASRMTDSLAMLRGMQDRKGVELFFGHDAEQWASIPRAPGPLL